MDDDDDKEKCKGLITANECEPTARAFAHNKSKGNNRITSEFNQYFWPEIKDHQ